MKQAWDEIRWMVSKNALHKKGGFRLAEVQASFVLEQALKEFQELQAAPDDLDELADLFGVLIHYAIKKGWSMAQVQEALFRKLELRFEV